VLHFGVYSSTMKRTILSTFRSSFKPLPLAPPNTRFTRAYSVSPAIPPEHLYPHTYYSLKKPTPLSLKMMMEFHGDDFTHHALVRAGRWVHEELSIRLANQINSIDRFPYGLCLMPSVKKVRKWYAESVKDLHSFPPIRTFEDEKRFVTLLGSLFNKHSKTLIAMAKGVHELKRELALLGDFDLNSLNVTQYLDDFYLSRIGIRMLAGHHLALYDQLSKPVKTFVGLICTETSPLSIIQDAMRDAKYMCVRTHGAAPEVVLRGATDLTFPSVPSHLYYILFELMKNSMRAVTELHHEKLGHSMPPLNITIAHAEDNEDVAIKISDEGGGIKRSHYPKIFSYLYTTSKTDFTALGEDEPDDFGIQAPLAGMGCGLPLSRLYARYFGGELQLMSMEGFGTDAYLHLPRLGDKCEPIPYVDISR